MASLRTSRCVLEAASPRARPLAPGRTISKPPTMSTSSTRTSLCAMRPLRASRLSTPTPSPAPAPLATTTNAFVGGWRRLFHQTAARPQEDTAKKGLVGTVEDQVLQSMKSGDFSSYGITKRIYELFAAEADYTCSAEAREAGTLAKTEDGEEIGVGTGRRSGMWHDELGLLPTFSTWSHVTMLHMYLLVVRLRCLPMEEFKTWQTQLVDQFFYDAERRMGDTHGLQSRATRQRYLKDLWLTWRGVVLSYDEGLIRGDAALAAAVWRNLFGARDDDADLRRLTAVVHWMRESLRLLDGLGEKELKAGSSRPFFPLGPEHMRYVDVPDARLIGVLSPDGDVKASSSSPAPSTASGETNP